MRDACTIKDCTMRPTIIFTMLAMAFAGCGNSEDLLPPECRNFQLAIEDASVNIGHRFAAALEAIRGITNSSHRAVCYARWVEELCRLDVSNLDYRRQSYCIREVLDATRSGQFMVNEYHLPDVWMDITIDSTLKGLTWGQKQIDRLKPTMPYEHGNYYEYLQWRRCYLSACGCYRNVSANIEGMNFDNLCRGRAVSAAAQEKAKKKIEKFLGRKMRNEDERQRANEKACAELKDVEECKVGPDLKKLRPVDGCQK